MPLDFRQFWKLAVAAQLVTPQRAKQLHDEFRTSPAAADLNGSEALPLARWLVAQGVLDRETARALLAGRLPDAPTDRLATSQPPATRSPEAAPWVPPADAPLVAPRRARSRVPIILGAAAALLVIAAIVGAAMSLSRSARPLAPAPVAPHGEQATQPSEAPPAVPTETPAVEPVAQTSRDQRPPAGVTEIDDDGRAIWVSPTDGDPLSLSALPSGMQVLLVVRLADLATLDEGRRLLDALGPAAASALANLEQVAGLAPAEIEQLAIGFVADDAGQPLPALAVRSLGVIEPATRFKALGNPMPSEHGGKTYYVGARWAYYQPPDGDGRTLAVASPELIKEMIDRNGPPLTRRGFESLLRHSDDARHVTLLFTPAYLATDGKELLGGNLELLREPLNQFFDVRTEAVMLSAYLGESLFLELRAASPVEIAPEQSAAMLAGNLAGAAESLERYVAAWQGSPYGRMVINRLPRMVQLLADYTRGGAEDRQAVLRAYLPLAAAHNLALAAELCLAERPGALSPVTAAATPAGSSQDAAAALQRTVTLSFPRDTLEHAIELLGKEMDNEIVILGSDLQLEGITKNQSFGIDLRDRKAGDVLREILRLANPDGKLVYVIRAGAQGEAIYVTTRAAVTKRGEKLPAELARPEK
jgi:hypothetical protein